MANQSIYSERWIDLVFENRNKEYGAYQMRQQNSTTTLKALALGFSLMLLAVSTPLIMDFFGTKSVKIVNDAPLAIPIEFSSVIDPQQQTPKKQDIVPLADNKKEKPKTEVKKENLVDPTITDASKAKTDVATNLEAQENQTSVTEEGAEGGKSNGVLGGKGTDTQGNVGGSEVPEGNGPHIAAVLDKQPSFPGGMNKFYSYVAQNFRAPETQLSNTIKVYVSFVIEKDGSITDIKVLRNPGFGLDQEAIRVLKSLKTKWTPGILNGKPVRTAYNLPIVIERKYQRPISNTDRKK